MGRAESFDFCTLFFMRLSLYDGLKIYGDIVFLPFLQENMNHQDAAAGYKQGSDKSDKERLQTYFFKGAKNRVKPDPGEA
jgi:hypothetical protein